MDRAVRQCGAEIVLSDKDEVAFSDQIPIRCLCIARLKGSVGFRTDSFAERNLFVILAYAPTDHSADPRDDRFKFLWWFVTRDDSTVLQVSTRISEAPAAYDGLKHLTLHCLVCKNFRRI